MHPLPEAEVLECVLRPAAKAGFLATMLVALDDLAGRAADAQETLEAARRLQQIDAEWADIASGAGDRAATAGRLGQEIAAGC